MAILHKGKMNINIIKSIYVHKNATVYGKNSTSFKKAWDDVKNLYWPI